MRYFGGKSRIAKSIAQELNNLLKNEQPFVDLFCGSCNIISKIDSNRIRIANDKHEFLIEMFKHLQNGWIPPENISETEYKNIKNNLNDNKHLSAFVGFGCSFAGKWFGGYARSNKDENFCQQSKNSLLQKISNMSDVIFSSSDYSNIDIPVNSLVYCDIPYKNSTQYSIKETGLFSHTEFYEWVRNNKNNFTVYISEYKSNIPSDFEIIWEKSSNKEIRNKNNIREETTEVLARLICE